MLMRGAWCAVLLALMCGAAYAGAQSAGAVSGSVADQTGALLPGVQVSIRGAINRQTETDAAGHFAIPGLPDGDYEIAADLPGFEGVHRGVRVLAGAQVGVSFTLRIAILEDTIVTASKVGAREIRALPMAITALSSAELERLNVSTLDRAVALVPSVTLSENTGSGQLTIRGIGTNLVNAGSDPSSAMYLDGVYLARPAMAFMQFLDLDRVEVLRGPQGTLYGRNAVGGAINLISRPPTDDLEASGTFTAGNFDEFRGKARISGPLARNRVIGSVAVSRGVQTGYVHDLENPNHPLGGDDVTAARGQVRVVFDRRTSLLLATDVDAQNGTPLTFSKVLLAKPGFQFDNPPDFHSVRTSAPAWNHTRQYGTSARLTAAFSPATTLVSLTAFRSLDHEFFVDADITELDLLTTHQRDRQHQWSQEITVAHQDARLTWVAGTFFFGETDHQTYWVDQFAAGVQVQLDPRVVAASRAAFGQATISLTPRLSATGGVRYTHEDKTIDNAGGRYDLDLNVPLSASLYGYADAITHDAWTPKLGIDLKLPHDLLAYASATRGFKSGGFNLSSTIAGRGYAPEWAWSYEGGLKGARRDGRSRFAVSAFDVDYTNLQVQTPIGIGVFDIRNAAAATIRGIELENASRIGRGVEAGGYVTWLDAAYDRYTAVNNLNVSGDVSGNRLNNAPEWAGRFWIEWTAAKARSSRLSISADATAQSTVYYAPFNDTIQRQRPYGLLSGRVEYGPNHRRWEVAAYGRNLTNTDYITATFGTAPTAFGGRPGPSREFAIDLTIRR